jgi:hypothetical protein
MVPIGEISLSVTRLKTARERLIRHLFGLDAPGCLRGRNISQTDILENIQIKKNNLAILAACSIDTILFP